MNTFIAVIILIISPVCPVNATLIDNGDGTVTQIRDDFTYGNYSRLMWLKDANPQGVGNTNTRPEAVALINSLNNSFYLGYNDWRLPLSF